MEQFNRLKKRSEDYQEILPLIKQLQNKVFVGHYTERRFIEPLLNYADIIEIDQKDTDFVNILWQTSEKLKKTFDNKIIRCILGDKNQGLSIFCNLSGCAFGSYWFMIKDITFSGIALSISVQCLRSYEVEAEPLTTQYIGELWNNFDYSKFLSSVIYYLALTFTKENITSASRFIGVLILSLAAGLYEILQLLLKFFQELNQTIRICVPIIIAAIEALTAAFGGLLIFLTYLFKSNPPRMPNFNLQNKPKYLQYEYSPNGKFNSYRGNYQN